MMELAPSMKHETLEAINAHLVHARRKHGWHPDMADAEKFKIVESELNEMAAAMIKGDVRGKKAEALDCAATLIRIIEED
ncbi:MAG: hypothetical protein LBV80_08000 [Deltaproteobacteria bacterium]|jgi:hypothetical protein|nr:hypothetical protein [Deltaproteobacteria bacterium]